MATCDRRGGRVCACPTGSCAISPSWGLFTGRWLQEVTTFSRAFLLVVVQEEEGGRMEEEVSLGVIMTNTEIKFHIVLFTLL